MNAINAVVFYKNLGNYQGTIEALGTLRGLLVPPVREETKQIWEEYDNAIKQVVNTKGVDVVHTLQLMKREHKRILNGFVDPIVEASINALWKHKFFNADWGSKPDNPKGGSFT